MLRKLISIFIFAIIASLVACSNSPAEEVVVKQMPVEQPAVEVAAPVEPEKVSPAVDLQIIWFEWQPCQALTQLVSDYPEANVQVRCVPHKDWHDEIFNDFEKQSGADLVILDSQFIGEAVTEGHIIEMTEWAQDNIELDKYVPAALTAYGEYPPGSKQYYGVAFEADTQMLVYRQDLFKEAGFEAPRTWGELLEQAKFFKESDSVPYGYVTGWCGPPCYDIVQTTWNQIAWSFGGELWNPDSYTVEGILNSPENVEALKFTAELYKTGPENAGDYNFENVIADICSGKAAMTTIWFGFGPSLIDASSCAQAENLAFGVVPAGPKDHAISLGGMGLHISAYSKNQEAALKLIAWLESKEMQLKWAELGGFSARTDILASDTFIKAAPYNPAFSVSYPLVKDFWNLPEYIELLEPQGEYLNLAITGQMDPQEALDKIATQQQTILNEAYPDGPIASSSQ